MEDKFVLRPRKSDKKVNKTVLLTIRAEKELQEELDKLAAKCDRSRNEIICMALRYALDHVEFIPESPDEE